MATGLVDRSTGKRGAPSQYEDQSYATQQATVTGPRTDVSTVSGTDRTQQTVSSFQSARNTTPTVLNILDQFVQQLFGVPTRQQAAEAAPQLEEVTRPPSWGGIRIQYNDQFGTRFFRDPLTGKDYNYQEGLKINAERQAQQRRIAAQQESPPANQQGAATATQTEFTGTPDQQRQQRERATEIERNRAAQGAYSKEAAFTDAQSLVNKSIQDALEKAMPGIVAASEGAGTSKSSMAALLAQRAAERGAVEGAALGAQTAVAYGGIQNQLASTLEALTRSDPNSPATLLLQALIGSKGLVSEQSGSQDTSGISQKQQQGITDVGGQTVMQNAVKEILQPLQQLNSITQTQPASTRTAVPRATRPSGIVVQETPSSLDESYSQYISPTEVSIYSPQEVDY